MNRTVGKVSCTFCACASVRDNPYGQLTQPKEYAAWNDALWAVWEECQPANGVVAMKEEAAAKPNQSEFALVWRLPDHPFRLHLNDVVRLDGRLGRVIRVTESAAVVLLNRPARVFTTRFDKPVRFQQGPKLTRLSANAEIEVLNRQPNLVRKRGRSAR